MPRFAPYVGAAVTAAVGLLCLLPSASGAAAPAPRVTVISDSILTSVTWAKDGVALADLSDGFDLEIDAGVGRRLNGQSAEFNGSYVPTTLDVIHRWGNDLGSAVVIVDGYNDLIANFAEDVELTLDTLRDDGVTHVLWVNLHEVQPEFVTKNAILAAAARRHPELRILDWNTYASGHPEWYQNDFIHLMPAGGVAIASWLHAAIFDTLHPDPALIVPAREPLRVRVGVRVDHRLRASGGTAPLRWRTTGLALHRAGLHLLAGGVLTGTPAHAGAFSLPLAVTDARGSVAHVTVALNVRSTRQVASRRSGG